MPKSQPAMLTPAYCTLPEVEAIDVAAEVLVALVEVLAGFEVVAVVLAGFTEEVEVKSVVDLVVDVALAMGKD